MNQLKVSIIIPAYNASQSIAKTIEASLNQSYLPFEVIVVDDGSQDNTAEIVASFKFSNYLYQDNSGPAAARNRGAQHARGDILLFTDSDCVPRHDWIENIIKGFNQKNVAAVMGSYGIANLESILSRVIHGEIIYRHHKIMSDYPKAFGSYNVGIRKVIFEEVEGFDVFYKRASGEDNDLSYKIIEAGHKIFFNRNALVDHWHTENLWKYLREQFQHGFWRVNMYVDHPDKLRGDDYTFWKDSVEVGLIFLMACFFWIDGLFFLLVVFLLLIELFFAWVMVKDFKDKIMLFFMMLMRSFFRSFGFSSGILSFFILKLIKKNK